MACDRNSDALSDVAAGAAASTDLLAHLAACEACRTELAVLRQALAVADEEMTRLLAVEPRPEVDARIRSAVAASEPVRPGRAGWLGPALAAAALLVVALAVILTRPPSPEPTVAVDTRPPPPPHTPAGESALAGAASGSALSQGPRPAGRPAAPAEPEVLVPTGGTEALLRLVTLVHRERLTPAVLGAVDRPAADLAELRPIDIKPLEIVPLGAAESSGT